MKDSCFYKKLTLLLLFTLPLLAMTCEEESNSYELDKTGKPYVGNITTITSEEFNSMVVGKGWRLNNTILLNQQGKGEVFHWVSGSHSGPADLFFSNDELFLFVYEKEHNLLKTGSYVYEPRENLVECSLAPYMRITYVSEWLLITIERLSGDDKMGVYVENTYESMSEHELNAKWLGFKAEEE